MWLVTLLDRLTCFIPRVRVIPPDSGGFRCTPKPWRGWPWAYWPWIRQSWICKPWKGKPWREKDNVSSTWLTELKPGEWYWIWPLLMEYEMIKIKTQVKDIRAQSVWTKSGHDITVGTSVRYYVQKPLKALLDVHDYDESLQNIVLGVVCDYVRKHTLEELKLSIDELRERLLDAVKKESSGWGLWIQNVFITDIGQARNFRVLLSGLEQNV